MLKAKESIVRHVSATCVAAALAAATPVLGKQQPIQVLFQPASGQVATMDRGLELVVSQGPSSEVRMLTPEPDEDGRLELPFLFVNRSNQPITVGPENVAATSLTLVPYDQLMEQQRRHEGHKKFGNFLASLAMGLSTVGAGNEYGSFDYSGMSSGGGFVSGSGSLTLYNPYLQRQADAEASAAIAGRTERMHQSFAADRNALGANLRTTTIMPGQQLNAVLTFDVPKALSKVSTSQAFTIAIQFGSDRHVLNGFLGPAGSLPAITYLAGAPAQTPNSQASNDPTARPVVAAINTSSRTQPPAALSFVAEPRQGAPVVSTEPTIERYHRGEYTGQPEQLAALAKKGFGPAQYELGTLYEKGKGVPQDSAHAAQLFKMATAQGVRDAETSLGWMYEKGEGVPRNVDAAEQYYALAARQGDEIASTRLIALRSGG